MTGMISAVISRARVASVFPVVVHPLTGAPPSGGLDTSIVVALIGLGGVIGAGLIAGVFTVYLANRSDRHAEQAAFLQRELDRRLQQEERTRQLHEESEEAARAAMLSARTRQERTAAYRRSLHADPRIARLQIIDMTWPLDIPEIYVQLRLHQETSSGFLVDVDLSAESEFHDPNMLLKRGQALLEQRATAALPPEHILQIYKRCVVVGDPGAGKSTLLKYLALRSVDGALPDLPDLPIHVELQAFAASSQRDPLDFIADQWENRYGFPRAEARAHLHTVLTTGQALLLLDALDETVTGTSREEAEESYQRVSQVIIDLATRYSLAPIVVTVRKAGYHQRARLPGFTEVEVLDFRREEITQFIERWFAVHPDQQRRGSAPDLLARLERNPRIYALAASPLLLSLIVLVYENQRDLPERRAELYRQCVETLLNRWDTSRNIRRWREFKSDQKRLLLEEVAWHFHVRGQRYFPESELLQCVATFLPAIGLNAEQNREVLAEIAAENGLLKEQAHGWYGFLHLTLQEYFVAQYAADHQQFEILLEKRNDPRWEEVFLLYAGRLPDASMLLQRLLAASHGRPGHHDHDLFATDLLLAGRCLGASPMVRQPFLRAEITGQLFLLLQETEYTLTQEQIARTLVGIGGDVVVPHLLALLSDEQKDPSLRRSVASALGTLGDRSLAPHLLALLPDEQVDPSVRMSIADALGRLGDRSLAPCLLTMLYDQQVALSVRVGVAIALGMLGDRSLARQMLDLLSDQQVHPLLCGSIAIVVGMLGDRSLIPHLLTMLHDDHVDSSVRQSIADALGMLGDHSLAHHLLPILSDQQASSLLRRSIAATLGRLGNRSITPRLLTMLRDERIDPLVRMNIADTLGMLGDPSLATRLLALLREERVAPAVRIRVATALGRLGDHSLVPHLLILLRSEHVDTAVRRSIAIALGRLGEHSLVPRLLAMLSDQQVNPSVRRSIAATLGSLGNRSITFHLLALVRDTHMDPSVRRSITNTLSALGENEDHVRLLAELLPTSDIPDSIHRALWTLSRQFGLRIYISNSTDVRQVKVVSVFSEAQAVATTAANLAVRPELPAFPEEGQAWHKKPATCSDSVAGPAENTL